MRRHAHVDVLDAPGSADLTAHVDFAALARIASAHGLAVELATQGEFLLRMGLLERAGRLGREADETMRERLSTEVERLAAPDQMGRLFKVMTVRSDPSLQDARQATD
jgi:SAM-dependent MidA family methyltransferase